MKHIEFTNDLLSGNLILDNQHKKIISLYNDYVTLVNANGIDNSKTLSETHNLLNDLIDYTQMHFDYEENFMKKIDYSDFDHHQAKHWAIVEKLSEYCIGIFGNFDRSMVITDIANFFEDWIINHIKRDDFAYMEEHRHKQ